MPWTGAALLTVTVLILIGVVIWYAASRIDRMHRRVEHAWSSLQLQLARWSSLALDLAYEAIWDPVTSIAVSRAALAALDAAANGEEFSQLSGALRAAIGGQEEMAAALADPVQRALLLELAAAWYRVILARRFLNDAVARTRLLRTRRTVRWLHLAGRTPMPVGCDIDDAAPDGLIDAHNVPA
jgi:hypothetical protein